MSTFAANNITTWFAGYDMTGDLNQVQMPIEFEAQDSTTFGTQAVPRVGRSRKAGLETVSSSLNGFVDFDDDAVDEQAFGFLSGSAQPLTHTPTGAEGDVAYFWEARHFSYQAFGQVGAMTPFSLSAQSSTASGPAVGAVRGRVLKGVGSVSATGATGTAYELGEVAAGQHLYAALHVFSVGTTLTVVLESDDNADFSSATTRATFSGVTAVGGHWAARVAGAITDTFYRFRVTAVTGTFSIAGVAGIK